MSNPNGLQELTTEEMEQNDRQAAEHQIMEVNKNAVAVSATSYEDEAAQMVAQFAAGGNSLFFSTIKNDGTRATSIKMYNAISEAISLRECVNMPLQITDYMAHPVRMLDEQTGEYNVLLRIILVDVNGDSYAAISSGIRSSIERLTSETLFGPAPWTPGIKLCAVEKAVKSSSVNRVLTLKLLADVEVHDVDTSKKK